jgi:16S rRNA (guanine966-N2)-methyltransferase
MRVISGSAGGLLLKTPPNPMRPTMDRVKAAIFSSLGNAVPGARVLDLYAGSGAYGIEALSRGAESAEFVEADRRAVEIIRENLAHTHLRGEVVQGEVLPWLTRAGRLGRGYDLVFADPPYELGQPREEGREQEDGILKLLESLVNSHVLERGGTLVLEQAAAQAVRDAPGLSLARDRRYGKARVCYFTRAV